LIYQLNTLKSSMSPKLKVTQLVSKTTDFY